MIDDLDEKNLWFKSVIQPKLDTLTQLALGQAKEEEAQIKEFMRSFLGDLEHLGLDTFAAEGHVEKILDGYKVLEELKSEYTPEQLKKFATTALLPSVFDRILFFSSWMQYRAFRRKHPDIIDVSILNAYLIPKNIHLFVQYVQKAFAEMPNLENTVSNYDVV